MKQLFWDVPIQMWHFHQKQIITRYLTNRPKLEAGIELKKITAALCRTHERDFTDAMNNWHQKWSTFLKEKNNQSVYWQMVLYSQKTLFRLSQFKNKFALFVYLSEISRSEDSQYDQFSGWLFFIFEAISTSSSRSK